MTEYREAVSDDIGAINRRKVAAILAGVLAAGALAQEARAQVASSDMAAMNFALNLQYLCGQYLSIGVLGVTVAPEKTRGFGFGGAAGGPVTGGSRMTLSDRTMELPLQEIAFESIGGIDVLRGILRGDLAAQPALDLSSVPFTTFMRSAGVIGGTETFDAFASPDNFLLGAYLIADTMVTAYRGLVPTIADPIVLVSMAGLMSTRAAHAATIRQLIYRRSVAVPALLRQSDLISDQRDRLDGASDLDQGISPTTVAGQAVANITACDPNGEVFARTPQQILNILYGTAAAASRGGFFPAGVAGSIATSAAN